MFPTFGSPGDHFGGPLDSRLALGKNCYDVIWVAICGFRSHSYQTLSLLILILAVKRRYYWIWTHLYLYLLCNCQVTNELFVVTSNKKGLVVLIFGFLNFRYLSALDGYQSTLPCCKWRMWMNPSVANLKMTGLKPVSGLQFRCFSIQKKDR